MPKIITANTGLLGLFGNPVAHSVSPLFMNYTLERLGLDFVYGAFRIQPDQIEQAVNSLRTLGLRGINITIPFKRAVMAHIQSVGEDAGKIGAVNCIVNDDGFLTGYNTDYIGFMKPLSERHIPVSERSILIIGSGGAARAVVYALIKARVREISIVNRTPERAESLVRW